PLRPPRLLPSFPTRRSSDLGQHGVLASPVLHARLPFDVAGVDQAVDQAGEAALVDEEPARQLVHPEPATGLVQGEEDVVPRERQDRKSTRLNSSHVSISYAV